ncbi:hypothetical protein DUI87_10712 [Hirundo rustica rustica]|uniref:Uncharacterized protein n=1 Tax=Hirundo rustica rustica TaxID=333673 RepID=A0A3M0KIV9_HIRRU|nr:hypothetical protein DUI87_10712 [Hirundo rustica rustica]
MTQLGPTAKLRSRNELGPSVAVLTQASQRSSPSRCGTEPDTGNGKEDSPSRVCYSGDPFVSDDCQSSSAALSPAVVNSGRSHQGEQSENICDPFLEFGPIVQHGK